MSDPIGELAAALARAQTAYKPVKRDRTVTVQTKSGGSYTFSYGGTAAAPATDASRAACGRRTSSTTGRAMVARLWRYAAGGPL